ncbi:MAG: Rpn family recombination-promoting nuclease/putative transposase [Leptolyngbyaceae cyanobacterium RU_5_1]|nr:Rpn family recombination-promoting nuclease/putative transposase [Leptolyngbyaceae cyanobacterium RU_5_1]
MKRDAIFYQIFKRFPSLLFTLIEQPPVQARGYRFESVEVKEPTFRIDGVFLPPDNASPRIVFFAEVQFQKDEDLYHRFFAASLLYLYRNRSLYDDWYGVVIFASRSLEPENTTIHRSLLNGDQVRRIYLDELGNPDQQPVGISLMQLTIAPEAQAIAQARQLIERTERETAGTLARGEIIEIIATIAFYKFVNRSREEVETMLGLSLEDSQIYREVKEEGKEEALAVTVPLLLKTGMTVEQIAQQTGIDVEVIRRIANLKSKI